MCVRAVRSSPVGRYSKSSFSRDRAWAGITCLSGVLKMTGHETAPTGLPTFLCFFFCFVHKLRPPAAFCFFVSDFHFVFGNVLIKIFFYFESPSDKELTNNFRLDPLSMNFYHAWGWKFINWLVNKKKRASLRFLLSSVVIHTLSPAYKCLWFLFAVSDTAYTRFYRASNFHFKIFFLIFKLFFFDFFQGALSFRTDNPRVRRTVTSDEPQTRWR